MLDFNSERIKNNLDALNKALGIDDDYLWKRVYAAMQDSPAGKCKDRCKCDASGPASGAVQPVTSSTVTDECAVVYIELPGVKKQDVSLSIGEDGTSIEVKGTRKLGDADTVYSRGYTISDRYDVYKASSKYEDGVLTVTIPVKEAKKRKSIFVG